MSLLFTEDKKELIVTCQCGCEDAFHFILDDMGDDFFAFITFMKADFTQSITWDLGDLFW